MKFYLLTFIFCTGIALTTQAQNSTERTVNDATQAIGTLKGLFGKKKTADNKPDATAATSNTSGTNQPANKKASKTGSKAQPYVLAGKIAPNAKVIDCDELMPFNLGAAVIRKGSSYALIDTAGKFIVPYNRYSSIAYTSEVHKPNGIFIVRGTDAYPKAYYMNNKGKILSLVSSIEPGTSISLSGKYIITYTGGVPNVTLTIMDKDGNKHVTHTAGGGSMFDSTFVYYEKARDGHQIIGLRDLNNNVLVKPTFTDIRPFENGIALFAIKDEFGRNRFGAINNKTKITLAPVPTEYKDLFIMGNDFSDIISFPGGAKDDYDNAFYNVRTGKMIYKQTKETEKLYGTFSSPGNAPYPMTVVTGGITYLMDDSGNVSEMNSFLNKIGIKIGADEWYTTAAYGGTPRATIDVVVFTLTDPLGTNFYDKEIDYCFYNTKTGKVIIQNCGEEDFRDGRGRNPAPFVFDPVAHLTYAIIRTGKKDNLNNDINIDGYMNADGVFKIIKGSGQ